MTPIQPTGLGSRITSIDSLRGFALAGIVIVHMVEQFLAGAVPEGVKTQMSSGLPDNIVDGLIFLIFRGKFFALFAFLFGISFFIQMDRAAQKGKDFRGRFVWRLTLLLVVGLIHNLFYRGDILTIYVMIGFLLPLFYNASNKVLITVAIILFLGGGRYLSFLLFGNESIFGGPDFLGSGPDRLAYWNTLTQGTLWDVFKDNAVNGLLGKLDFQFGVFGRGYLTLGFFLIGLWVARLDLFNRFEHYKKSTRKVLWWSVGISVVGLGLTAFLFSIVPQPVTFDSWLSLLALTAYDIHNVGMTAVIVCVFLLVFYKKETSYLGVFSKYGQTALSNYVIQSVIGTFIFYNWGMGYLGEVRNIYAFLLAIFIIISQIILSNLWMEKFKYGPLEWLWRCGTHLKKMPFRKRNEIQVSAV